jgi:alkaline phosphatase D
MLRCAAQRRLEARSNARPGGESISSRPLRRRQLLAAGLAAPAILVFGGAARSGLAAPFALGVASGEPAPDGFVLWTRLVPPGGLGPEPVELRWEVAADERMTRVLRHGTVSATVDEAHSAHVEVAGLEPGRWYWYRFYAGGEPSPTGRTRTAPAPGTSPERLRFAFASCQHYEQGYYAAHRDIAERAPDLVAFLGDYIYETSWGDRLVRRHDAPEATTLAAYRARYALYKTDPDLQAAHAAAPWIVTWDDHEVADDYAADRARSVAGEAFLARREAAYRAFWEHMPLRRRAKPVGAAAELHRRIAWGDLAQFHVLDDRQYRSYQPCAPDGGGGVAKLRDCPELGNARATMLGRAQERWLEDGLARSAARWNVLAQQTRMARRGGGPEADAYWTDGWDGYSAARRRLLEFIAARRPGNPLVIGGDIHAFMVSELRPDFRFPETPAVATECVTSSVTSHARPIPAAYPADPHIRFADADHRGYVEAVLTPREALLELRAVADPADPASPVALLRRFAVADGSPGANPL